MACRDDLGILVVSVLAFSLISPVLNAMTFGSLKNHVVNDFVDPMFDLGRKVMALSFEEKMEYWQGNGGGSFG